jgi:nitroreductase
MNTFPFDPTHLPEEPPVDTLTAIFSRRSESKLKPDAVPRDIIERLLEAAVQAPNHHRVRPWRFFIIQGDARQRLGGVMAASLLRRKPDVDPAILDNERVKPLRAPLIIAVAVDRPVEPKVREIENIAAVSAAIQNLLLAAHHLGLAGIWRTGDAAYDPGVKAFFGLEADQTLLAFVYLGYLLVERKTEERLSYQDRTTWME